jgi:hypothetical protein
VRKLRSIDPALSPEAKRRLALIASEAPARKTNVGAQRCVTRRARNCPAGNGVPGS